MIDAARSLVGVPFIHQGRSAASGLDCVGMIIVLGHLIKYPHEIADVEGYARTPSAGKLLEMMNKNLDEIPLSEVRAGDIYLMRVGGIKPRHTAVRVSDELDIVNGKEPTMVHALNRGRMNRVVEHRCRQWQQGFVKGFRIRGLIA